MVLRSMFLVLLVFMVLNISLVKSCNCTIEQEPCKDWTMCQTVRCAAPKDPCPKEEPYPILSTCGCCQGCSKCPKKGPCGVCGVDVRCKEPYPICTKENQIVTIDYCGCCRVCKDLLGEGQECQAKEPNFAVCNAGLKCIDGKCQKV